MLKISQLNPTQHNSTQLEFNSTQLEFNSTQLEFNSTQLEFNLTRIQLNSNSSHLISSHLISFHLISNSSRIQLNSNSTQLNSNQLEFNLTQRNHQGKNAPPTLAFGENGTHNRCHWLPLQVIESKCQYYCINTFQYLQYLQMEYFLIQTCSRSMWDIISKACIHHRLWTEKKSFSGGIEKTEVMNFVNKKMKEKFFLQFFSP